MKYVRPLAGFAVLAVLALASSARSDIAPPPPGPLEPWPTVLVFRDAAGTTDEPVAVLVDAERPINEFLGSLVHRKWEPSGGVTRWVIETFGQDGNEQGELWMFADGEWGFGGGETEGYSSKLPAKVRAFFARPRDGEVTADVPEFRGTKIQYVSVREVSEEATPTRLISDVGALYEFVPALPDEPAGEQGEATQQVELFSVTGRRVASLWVRGTEDWAKARDVLAD